uniref:Integrase domain protein n=1 Tax=uncultured bacterium contig00015 TaxID=1181506 RepID=A0A806K2R1_9BACT|nr:integrase domain protein [uncultured bacterium contig00015]
MGLTMQEKKALTGEVSKRYQKAGRKEKTKILDELVENTGYNRKYILHVLANWGKTATVRLKGKTARLKACGRKRRKGGGRKPKYTGEFVVVLRRIWAFFMYRCGKILSSFIRSQIKFLEAPFHVTPEVMELLLSVSPATIDRLLKGDRKKLAIKGKSGTKPGKLLKKQIPVRTYYADADKKPGFFEVDTVHHCGTSDSGEFCLTLTATDVYSGWVELRPTLNKAHKWVFEALVDIKSSLPFPLAGIDSDNGSEFINDALLKWCRSERIQFTRARAYHKNDNCFVEQKNYSCVRNFVGYYRFSAAAERDALASVYHSLCPLLNYFMPTFKLIKKLKLVQRQKRCMIKML